MWWLSVADVAEREVFFFADKAQPAAARIWLLTHHNFRPVEFGC